MVTVGEYRGESIEPFTEESTFQWILFKFELKTVYGLIINKLDFGLYLGVGSGLLPSQPGWKGWLVWLPIIVSSSGTFQIN